MTYVDQARWPLGRMLMCHLTADSEEELHRMADQIGVARRHFQPGLRPHYDCCKSKRELAIRHGAVAVTSKDLVRKARELGKKCLHGRDYGPIEGDHATSNPTATSG